MLDGMACCFPVFAEAVGELLRRMSGAGIRSGSGAGADSDIPGADPADYGGGDVSPTNYGADTGGTWKGDSDGCERAGAEISTEESRTCRRPRRRDASEPPLPTTSGAPDPQAAAATPATDAADQYLPKSKDGKIEVQVIDLLYAAQDSSMLHGFRREDGGDDRAVDAGRFAQCEREPVQADADVHVLLRGGCEAGLRRWSRRLRPPTAGEMSWVKVVGKVTFPVEGGRTIPVLVASKVEPVDPPAETMLY